MVKPIRITDYICPKIMSIDQSQLRDYLDGLVPERPPELQKMEAYAHEQGFPIIGPASGYLCYQLARMMGAKRIFELGSGYGYSTAWFAQAVQENLARSGAEGGGEVVHHVVWDEGLSQMAQGHLARLGYAGLIQYHVSEAVEALRQTDALLPQTDHGRRFRIGRCAPWSGRARPGQGRLDLYQWFHQGRRAGTGRRARRRSGRVTFPGRLLR